MKIKRINYTGSWDDICPYCKQKQENHKICYPESEDVIIEHRMPCKEEQEKITREYKTRANTARIFSLILWIIIPLAIIILGFTSFYIGLSLFIISLLKLFVTYIKLFGNPERWIPGYKEKTEKRRKMEHYYYHCELNPDGFTKLKLENFEKEEETSN